jgi:hypothetical protein
MNSVFREPLLVCSLIFAVPQIQAVCVTTRG